MTTVVHFFATLILFIVSYFLIVERKKNRLILYLIDKSKEKIIFVDNIDTIIKSLCQIFKIEIVGKQRNKKELMIIKIPTFFELISHGNIKKLTYFHSQENYKYDKIILTVKNIKNKDITIIKNKLETELNQVISFESKEQSS